MPGARKYIEVLILVIVWMASGWISRFDANALGNMGASGTRKHVIDKTGSVTDTPYLEVEQSHQSLPPSGESKQII
jgi:hypothetical protein